MAHAIILGLAVVFLLFSLPAYLGLDPTHSRLPLREGFAWHYPMLVAHIGFGSVALLTCCLQIWPKLRERYPVLHRRVGRIYVLAGVLPAGLLGIVVGATAVIPGLAGKAGNITLAIVWLAVTFAGFRAARRRRIEEHRRWMIRSFSLTTSIVVNRLWVVGLISALRPFLNTHFGGDMNALIKSAAEASIWLSWVVNLLVAEWWIERGRAGTLEWGAQKAPISS